MVYYLPQNAQEEIQERALVVQVASLKPSRIEYEDAFLEKLLELFSLAPNWEKEGLVEFLVLESLRGLSSEEQAQLVFQDDAVSQLLNQLDLKPLKNAKNQRDLRQKFLSASLSDLQSVL